MNDVTLPTIPDPQTTQVVQQISAPRFTLNEPTWTPRTNETWVYYDTTDYWFYVYANGGWRKVKLS
jgi:hypothetical protein